MTSPPAFQERGGYIIRDWAALSSCSYPVAKQAAPSPKQNSFLSPLPQDSLGAAALSVTERAEPPGQARAQLAGEVVFRSLRFIERPFMLHTHIYKGLLCFTHTFGGSRQTPEEEPNLYIFIVFVIFYFREHGKQTWLKSQLSIIIITIIISIIIL